MRAREFLGEDALSSTTTAASMAPISHSLGSLISRAGSPKPAKYANSVGPARKRKKPYVSR